MNETQPAEQRLLGDRMIERMPLIWTIIFYIWIVFSLLWAIQDPNAPLRGWQLIAALVLCGASVALHQLIYWPEPGWPMRPRVTWIYFSVQLLILAALLTLSGRFFGLGFAFLGQTFGALRPRWWVLVLMPLFGLMASPFGWFEAVIGGDWPRLVSFVLVIGIWLVVGGLLTVLYDQRFRLLTLVGELRRAKGELEATAAQQEELAVLRERNRLAREMHDSLGHALVAVNVKLEAAQRLYQVDAARGDAELEATRELVRATMGKLRHSIADLRAPAVDHHNLPAALRRLADEVSARSGVTVTFVEAPEAPLPPPSVAEALFLIAREALVNVERHASAERAEMILRCNHDQWYLEVVDDGVGVRPVDLRKPGHFGVVGIRERANALGGQVELSARAAGGTCVVARIPDSAIIAA